MCRGQDKAENEETELTMISFGNIPRDIFFSIQEIPSVQLILLERICGNFKELLTWQKPK